MAFKQLSTDSSAEDLLWANEYIEQNPTEVGQLFDVREIKLGDKGFTFVTKQWKGFLFKSSPVYNHVKEFVLSWKASKQPSPVLQCKLTKNKPYFIVGTDDDRKCRWSVEDKYYHQSYNSGKDNSEYNENPLPLPKSPTTVYEVHAGAQDLPDEELDAVADEAAKMHRLTKPGRALKPVKDTNTSEAS